MSSPPKSQHGITQQSDGVASLQCQDAAGDRLLSLLESQALLLDNLLSRVQNLKDAPARLLAGALSQLNTAGSGSLSALSVQSLGADLSTHASNAFAELRAVDGQLRDDQVQAALSLAKAHEPLGRSLASLKRKRDPSEASTTPVRAAPPRSDPTNLDTDELPSESPGRTRISKASLPAFIREHNKTGAMPKLHIWSAKASEGSSSSVVVRMSVVDVLVAFVTFEDTGTELVVEAVSVFGPRETKPVYSQSDFDVYRKMNQHVVRLVRRAGEVSVQRVITLFQAYGDVFEAHCTSCKRVVSETDHIPAVEISFSENAAVFQHVVC